MWVCRVHALASKLSSAKSFESGILMGQCSRPEFNPWVGKIPWRRERQPTRVFLRGEIHGQRSLAGYSPRACKELNTTEQFNIFPGGSCGKSICLQCGRPGVPSLGREDSLEKAMATHSGTLAWKIPRTEKPGRLQSMESQSRTRLSDFTHSLEQLTQHMLDRLLNRLFGQH